MLNSISPVWDGNEVWLVTGGGALFAAFPDAYATVFSGFYLAFLIGVAMGNIVRGIPLDRHHEFTGSFLGLLNPYSLFFGVTTVLLFAMHGAIYVVMKTEGVLQEKIRSWIPRLIGLFIVSYFLFNIFTLLAVDWVPKTVMERPWVVLVVILNALVVLNIPREIRQGREFTAFLSSCAGMVLMMATFGLTYFPYMVLSNPSPETASRSSTRPPPTKPSASCW